jgi:hypothetical protein
MLLFLLGIMAGGWMDAVGAVTAVLGQSMVLRRLWHTEHIERRKFTEFLWIPFTEIVE